MDQKTRKDLLKPLKEYDKPGAGGRKFSFVKGEDVIGRMNAVFQNEWSTKVLNHWMTDAPEGKTRQAMVLIEVSAGGITHEGFGGADVALYTSGPRQGEPVDVSNAYKSALTNAIKNACKQFGLGLISDENEVFGGETGWVVEEPVKPLLTVSTPKPKPVPAPASAPAPAPEPKPEVKLDKPLGQSFKEKEQKEEEKPSFVPSGNLNEKINDTQLNAINAMMKMKGFTPEKAVSMFLTELKKSSFEELTKSEAMSILRKLYNAEGK